MPERTRAYRPVEGQIEPAIVTILEGERKIGRRGKVKIRNQFGFVEEISGTELERIDESEPHAKLVYKDPD